MISLKVLKLFGINVLFLLSSVRTLEITSVALKALLYARFPQISPAMKHLLL